MRRMILVAIVLAVGSSAEAGPIRNAVNAIRSRVNPSVPGSVTPATPSPATPSVSPPRDGLPRPMPERAVSGGLAQQKAEQQAREGQMRHVGGSSGAGQFEGVGFSSVSGDDAVRRCCYWGQRTPVDIGVARGARGWYACVLYR